jgi:6-phosphogluconolactonase/glucosamine-6-phosphate isomerase/deaminase
MSNTFTFAPAEWIPFTDRTTIEKVRILSGRDFEKQNKKNLTIRVVPDVTSIWVTDMIMRIRESDEKDKKIVMIVPNPAAAVYETVAELINRFNIDCRNVHTFNMDEFADQEGNVAPENYPCGFNNSFLKHFFKKIDTNLRMPRSNCHAPTTENVKDYSRLITECGEGGADICYSGPGWTGHLAFIEPDMPEFSCNNIDEFLKLESRIVSLHPLTIAQNSLHGLFGCSGDLTSVPPRAATIGPADVVRSRNRLEMHAITTMGTVSSWQRMMSRLVLFGPVTPKIPSSILQLMPTSVYVSEEIASKISPMERIGY